MTQHKIDFVLPWVDGNDLEWQKEKAKYSNNNISDASVARYRDWDNLQYWFRGVEKFTPWVNKIYFITYGHLPKWLNTKNAKLKIINHKDYIPSKYLPVFSSRPIELNLHRISDLSECFVYFNDDCFILKKMEPNQFFKNGLPCDTAALSILGNSDLTHWGPILNSMRIVNEHFTKDEVLYTHKLKWFNLKYGKQLIRTLLLLPWKFIPNYYNSHGPNSYLKQTYDAVWKAEDVILDQTCSHKFREMTDVTQFLMKAWQLCEGNFEPRKDICKAYNLLLSYDELRTLILGRKTPIICLNDDTLIDFDNKKKELNGLLDQLLPEKSSYEL